MRKTTLLRIGPLLVAILLLPSYALANAGTPLMWFTAAHLVIGNFIIGLGEGLLIILIFKTRKIATLSIMILANYVSMFAGFSIIEFIREPVGKLIMQDAPLYNAPRAMVIMIILLYLLTIVLEWPFCLWILRKKPRRLKVSLTASAIVQTVSYAVIVPMYLSVSPISLYTDVKTDPSLGFANNVASVYYISDDGGTVRSVRTDGSDNRKVLDTEIAGLYAWLFVRETADGRHKELWVAGYPDADSETLLIKDFTDKTVGLQADEDGLNVPGKWFNDLGIVDFRPEGQRQWEVRTGDWAGDGLTAWNTATDEFLSVALETPFLSWYARNAAILPGDQVVYQLDDQIVLLDIRSRKMGLLATGRGPVVVLDSQPVR